MVVSPVDQTSYVQCLMHLIKGNIGAGILAMPASFAHSGLISGMIGLSILCFIAAYCAHLLIKSSRHLERKMAREKMDYAELAECAFMNGPTWVRSCSGTMSWLTNATLISCQIGISCVYLVFIVDNLHHMITTYTSVSSISKYHLFVGIFPFVLWLSCIRTLRRLAIASTVANFLQFLGVVFIVQYLIMEMPKEVHQNQNKPLSEMALAFGSAAFAFDGISILLPTYMRMKGPHMMDNCCGVINVGYFTILALHMIVGVLGYLMYGEQSEGSITLNLPSSPIFGLVAGIFVASIALTIPLQMYVPPEIIWNWTKVKFQLDDKLVSRSRMRAYESLSRFSLILLTFAMAMAVPNLNLIMDLFGSITAISLAITLPPIIHLSAYWNDTSGLNRILLVLSDLMIIVVGIMLSSVGAYFSSLSIYRKFDDL